ncbi:MAG TPA: phosphate/phosphite/phosphonate ABC transporter substrate-binding protein [Nitrospirota bacterium]
MNRTARRVLMFMVAACLIVPLPLSAASKSGTLMLGVFPYISANQMMDQLAPLCKRMEQALGKKITMVSAPDFMSFVDRTVHGEYDLVLTAAHMGRLTEQRDGWQPVVRSGQRTATVFLVRKESRIKDLKDLRGRKMAVGNARSVTYLLAEEALVKNGISPKKDMKVIETATFSNVVYSVFVREAEVGATPTLLWDNWENINKRQHRELREIFRTRLTIPSFLVMAPPGTSKATIRRLRESLLSFRDTPEGKAFFKKSQFESFLPLDEETMRSIDPYVAVLLKPDPK